MRLPQPIVRVVDAVFSRLDAAVRPRLPDVLAAESAMPRWRRAGNVVHTLLYRRRLDGVHQVPTHGPVVLVANHVGFLDGPVAYLASPRPTHFLVKRAYFVGPLAWLLTAVGQIPITQNSGDRAALGTARRVLDAGGVIGAFPEGTRGKGQVEAAQQGAAYLALTAKAVVVPVALQGTQGRSRGSWPRLRSRITVTFGPPFTLGDDPQVTGLTGRARLEAATEALRERLARHVALARGTG